MLFRRLLTAICPILLFIALELAFYRIQLIYFLAPFSLIILIATLRVLNKGKFFSREFWEFFILPFLFFIALTSVLFIVSSDFLRHALILAFALILFLYLENVFLFFWQPMQYQPFSFENFSTFLNLLIFFLMAINLNAFNIFLNAPFWLTSLTLIAISSLLVLQSFWASKIKNKFRIIYLLILNLIILEFFWCINFLPANFYVNSAILAMLYYFVWEIFRARLSGRLEVKFIWRYALLVFMLICLVVLTSRWI
jgi:hypothetical protein